MNLKRPSDERLRDKMNDVAMALLDAHYGALLANRKDEEQATLPDEEGSDTTTPVDSLPRADIFNAVVNWLKTDSGMEPAAREKSGVAALAEKRNAARK